MSKHTPGPWVVQIFEDIEEAHEEGFFRWADEWDIARNGRPALVWQRTECGGTTGLPGSIEVGEHNARLIAAAPDLLAALVLALEETGYDDPCRDMNLPAWVVAARVAIAKAIGDAR